MKKAAVDFADVVKGASRYDVCRVFLASLQLAANGNVGIEAGAGESGAAATIEPFALKLLTMEKAYDLENHM